MTDAGRLARILAGGDHAPVIDALREWLSGHPGCDDPAQAVRGVGLPDMTGIPERRALRTSAQQREYVIAQAALQHAGYLLRRRDAERAS